ncbi:nucleolar MIF4G domain-containing protein 1 homolog [Mercenaria mercenaria]|uniref:nucleolar MIF4G domain-containing protein 1 homolog n=1 Tax=Mercenaria mercenaria TaxID=6596 RepID=UPI00234EEDC8|nr:nucleolar MIF4G domain-containing protein 1 homolog [Mercenaria mercenaria]
MTKRKRSKIKDAPNLKRFRSEIQSLTHSERYFPRQGPKQTRKEKRKEARLEKKSRKNAYCRRLPIPSKEEIERAKNESIQQQKQEAKLKRMEEMKKKKKAKKERQKQQELESREEQRRVEDMWDDKEIRDLEKKLGLNKRKKKDTLPMSFKTDGLDYILDVVDTEKLQAMTNVMEDTEGDDFGLMGDDESDENDMDDDEDDYDDDTGDFENEDDEGSDLSSGGEEENVEDTNKSSKLAIASDQEKKGSVTKTNKTVESEMKGKEKWEELAERIQGLVEKKKISKKSVRFADLDEEQEVENDDNESDDGEEEESDDDDFGDVDDNSDAEDSSDENVNEIDNVDNGSDDDENDSDVGDDSDNGITDDIENHESDLDDDNDDSGLELSAEIPSKQNQTRKLGDLGTGDLKEDIYGRLRDSQGNIIRDNKPAGGEGAYVPPAKRLQMAGSGDEKKRFILERLQKQLKGLVNRASENNMQPISGEIEMLYLSNSRADVNETLVGLISDACIGPVLTPDRLSMELMMLVAILHGNVGSEVGAVFLQHFAKRLHMLLMEPEYGQGKVMDNVVVLIAHLYNFKVVHSVLVFDILKKLTESFKEKDIEVILLLLRHVGFLLRKDSPSELKDFIVSVQTRAGSADAMALADQSRVRFMLEVIMAIRNNNMRKIPNYDPEHLDHLRKLIKTYIRGGQFGDNQLHITLEDLLNAEEKGKWWLVGSAWDGKNLHQNQGITCSTSGTSKNNMALGQLEVSSKLQELARKQRMNTDLRRNIFFIIMTSEDYLDAFEKLIQLGLKSSQKQEIVLVILDCCLQEKKYNPFYSYLGQKFCEYHRTYQMAFQFCIWDKFKEIGSLSDTNRNNLAKLLNHLIVNKAQSLSILKVISFGTLEKGMVRLLKRLLMELLLDYSQSEIEAAFTRIAQIDKLKQLNEELRLFLRHFLVGKKSETKNVKLLERVDIVDRILSRGKGQVLL